MGGLMEFMRESGLPTRPANGLEWICRDEGWEYPPTKEQVANLSDGYFLRRGNIGHLSLAQIRAWQNGKPIPKKLPGGPTKKRKRDLKMEGLKEEVARQREALDVRWRKIQDLSNRLVAAEVELGNYRAIAAAPEGMVEADVIKWLQARGYDVYSARHPTPETTHAAIGDRPLVPRHTSPS
jgi:hypothetical protein